MTDTSPPSLHSAPSTSPGRWMAAFFCVAVAGSAVLAWKYWDADRAKKPEYIYATVQRSDFEDLVSSTGALQPRDYVDVGAQVSGQLRKLHVEVGSEVTEGQLLAEIDAEQSAARVDASRASLRALQAQLVQYQVNLDKAERDLLRLQNLYKDEATTLELVQNAETTVATTRAQINTQKAQIEQTQASMRVEESNLKYTKIYAPMAGTVVTVAAKQGQTLNTNQSAPTLLRIADQSTMTVQTQVSEADVTKLRVGMSAYFTTLGGQGRRWYGKLRKIEPTPTVTNNVVLYNALFDVDNQSHRLMAQMTAQVFFVVAEARDALVVPMSAVVFQRGSQGRRDGGARRGALAGPGAAETPGATGAAEGVPARRRPEAERRAPDSTDGAGRTGAPVSASSANRADAPRGEPGAGNRASSSGEGPQGGRPGGRPSGPSGAGASGAPLTAMVKVVDEEGAIVEREVTIGVSNRVQAQILSGLQEGERVVAGIKTADAPRRSTNAQQPGQQQGPGMGPGMGPGAAPGVGTGAAGGGRR